jgi:uncharacterized protein (TIGR02246 family)
MRFLLAASVLLAIGVVVSPIQHVATKVQAQAPRKSAPEQAAARSKTTAAIAPGAPADEKAIRESAQAFTDAFDRGDAKAVADLWSADGDYIDENGQRVRGRDAIARAYEEFFAANPGVKIKVEIDNIRLLGTDTAIEDGRSALDPAPPGPPATNRYTAVHVKRKGKWLLASVRDARIELSVGEAHLRALDWLVGAWESEKEGAKVEVTCRWISNKNFIEVTHTFRESDQESESAREIIGWDPLRERITSWMFNSDGGHAIGTWLPREHGWTVEFAGVTPDGVRTSAVNMLVRLDNAFVWKSVLRSAEGANLPDTEEVVLRRK